MTKSRTPKLSDTLRHKTKLALLGLSTLALSQTPLGMAADNSLDSPLVAHVQTAQFKIPFNVEARGAEPLKVQLWVSADDGATWQTYGSVAADTKAFDFRAAAEGAYLFKVATIDAAGTTYPNLGAPLKVLVDTTKPRAEVQADIDGSGHLVVDIKVHEEHLDLGSAVLRLRSDHQSQWRDLPFELQPAGDSLYSGQVVTELEPCREVAIVFSVKDRALNAGEATCQYTMPRTASGQRDITLASTQQSSAGPATAHNTTAKPTPTFNTGAPSGSPTSSPRLTSTPGATRWSPTAVANESGTAPGSGQANPAVASPGQTQVAAVTMAPPLAPGRLASNGQLSLDPPPVLDEELPLPPPVASSPLATGESLSEQPSSGGGVIPASPENTSSRDKSRRPTSTSVAKPAPEPATRSAASTVSSAYHCRTRAFSLDYSVQALGGSALADVELWGTEDGGREWQKWGSDPDRLSPFDVQVGNDGLFGFRMVVVGTNGIVSNRPREGDSADMWINVDTSLPTVKITRAVYGEGPEDGLLVIDYTCQDGHLVERPIAMSYSERAEGPWTEIATGLANTGLYLWKAAPNLPEKIYLKIDCVDKAGNVGSHRLDLPIDIRGLAPRGVIQGFRPIDAGAK